MSLIPKTQSTTNLPVHHVRKNDGDTRSLLGSLMSVRISTAETRSHFRLSEGVIAPNTAVPMHNHPDVEAFNVLDGSLSIPCNGW
jgi:hypothetical protein